MLMISANDVNYVNDNKEQTAFHVGNQLEDAFLS
jgi:hypothetical protein